MIRTRKEDPVRTRLSRLYRDVWGLLEQYHYGLSADGAGVVIEMHVGGMQIAGRAMRTEKQAMACAMVYGAVLGFTTRTRLLPPIESKNILTPTASTWTRNYAAKVGDQDGKNRDKTPRVEQAKALLGLKDRLAESKSHAADVADALLMAAWGAERLGVGQDLYANAPRRIIAFDPAIVTCGFAVVDWSERSGPDQGH